MERELGSIAPGRRADCDPDLAICATLPIETVIARGEVVARGGRDAGADMPAFRHGPRTARATRAHGPDPGRRRFRHRRRPREPTSVRARVIGVVENQAPTKALRGRSCRRGRRRRDGPRRRTSARSPWSNATAAPAASSTPSSRASAIDGDMAIASTVAHDSHHMIVVGTSQGRHGAGRQPAGRGRRRRHRLARRRARSRWSSCPSPA